MRVVAPGPRDRDESGAVAVIVALVLFAMFGMAMLTIDLGGMLVKKREMVNAADSAAIAAAQWCAEETNALALSGSAQAHADGVANVNVSDASQTQFSFAPGSECPGSSGQVTVEYEGQKELHFAPVLGLGDSRAIHATAIGEWGPAGAAKNVVPVMVNVNRLGGDCGIPEGTVGTRCAFWYDIGDLGTAQWGFLDLSNWDVAPGYNCPNAGAGPRSDWIDNGYPERVELNYPSATYVCTTSGLANSVWDTLADRVGDTLAFPVNDPDTQLMGANGAPDKYNIIGFSSLKLIGIYRGDSTEATGTSAQSATCSEDIAFDGSNAFYLDWLIGEANCYATTPETLGTPVVTGTLPPVDDGKGKPDKGPRQRVTFLSGTDYTYDASLRRITWHGPADAEDFHVSFSWSIPGTSGACEPPERTGAALARAKCVMTEWVGFTTEAVEPGGGADLGHRGYKLAG